MLQFILSWILISIEISSNCFFIMIIFGNNCKSFWCQTIKLIEISALWNAPYCIIYLHKSIKKNDRTREHHKFQFSLYSFYQNIYKFINILSACKIRTFWPSLRIFVWSCSGEFIQIKKKQNKTSQSGEYKERLKQAEQKTLY